jgi:hypothetical protein
MRRFFAAAIVFLALVAPALAQNRVLGLDHIPIVVRDLVRARADFQRLGFVLKPGREHANGLQNDHAKFADGTELELITATVAADALSTQYLEWMKEGDGAVSLGLYRPGARDAVKAGLFFDERQKSPTDLPEHFRHPNGAISLSAAWLAGSPAERQITELPGGKLVRETSCAPFGFASKSVRFKEGEVVLLPESEQIVPGRPILAATVIVQNLLELQGILAGMRVDYRQVPGCGRPSFWVQTHGLWLEFRERGGP